MQHTVLAFAGSPRRGGNSEKLLDSALAGVAAAAPGATVRKIVETKRVYVLKEDLGTVPRFYYYFG